MKRTNNKVERDSLMSTKLPPIRPSDTQKAIHLLQELSKWNPSPELIKEDNFSLALEAAHQAILESKKYMKHRREGGDRDGAIEDRLSGLWFHAGRLIQQYDGELAGLCYVKGNGWADEATWNAPQNRDLPIDADQMLERVRKLGETPPQKDVPNWFPIVGMIFTCITVVSLFYLLVGPQDLSSGRHIIFDVWVAVCLAASASFLGGTAKAHGQLPWPAWFGGKSPPIQFATAGGIAVFVIALLILLSAYH